MPDTELFKMGRLVNLDRFATRVKAAMLQQAAGMALGGVASNDKNLGVWVLKNPMANEPSMIALAAADPKVLAAASMVDGTLASDDAVLDVDIRAVVAAKWPVVATKYTTAQ